MSRRTTPPIQPIWLVSFYTGHRDLKPECIALVSEVSEESMINKAHWMMLDNQCKRFDFVRVVQHHPSIEMGHFDYLKRHQKVPA